MLKKLQNVPSWVEKMTLKRHKYDTGINGSTLASDETPDNFACTQMCI